MKKILALLTLPLLLAACQTPLKYGDDVSPSRRYSDIYARQTGRPQFYAYDPAEGVNRRMYKFNAQLDQYVLIPIVKGYKAVTPDPVERGIANFFLNVGEIPNFTNAVLQGSPKKAGITLVRFVTNTTAGLLGTIDVATKLGLERRPEDFGQTLGKWGVGPGPYLVLPVIGPTNLRDATGKAVDIATLAVIIPNDVEDDTAFQVVAYGLAPINGRAVNNFRYYASGSPFEYDMVRYLTNQSRKLQIEK